jgi:hypothetical protein
MSIDTSKGPFVHVDRLNTARPKGGSVYTGRNPPDGTLSEFLPVSSPPGDGTFGARASILMLYPQRLGWLLCAAVLIAPAAASAQDAHAGHVMAAEPESAWTWSWDANVFAGWNYQRRLFTDFQRLESQNWLMGSGARAAAGGRFRLTAMLSFEPFTMQALGSAQVFQTGETYREAPLIDYQHPHDLVMALGGSFARTVASTRAFLEVDAVGSPAIGPPVFMHRPSAADNPQAPLSHHLIDSTHITPGVVTAGITRAAVSLEGSWFRGLEPDENRTDIDFGRLDSWALRGRWQHGAWDAQVSGAHLTTPEWLEPFSNITRLTASAGYTRADGRLAALVAWGQNREIHGVLDGYLFEATLRARSSDAFYTRVEYTTKDILGAGGRHPQGFTHFHPLSKVGALTAGYVRDIHAARSGRYGAGADITVYQVPTNLQSNYGTSPLSFHVFLRYHPARRMNHVHQ